MEAAFSEAQEEQEATSSDHEDEVSPVIFQQNDSEDTENEEPEEGEEEEGDENDDGEDCDAAEEMCPNVTIEHAESQLSTASVGGHQQGPDESEQSLLSYGDFHQAEQINPNPNPNPSSYFFANPSLDIQAYPADFIDDRRPEMCAKFTASASVDNILINSPVELDTIPEMAGEEDTCKEDVALQVEEPRVMSEKENLGGGQTVPPCANPNQDHFSRRSLRLLKNLPPFLPITQQQTMALPPLRASKKEVLSRKVPINDGLKPVNDGAKPVIKTSKGEISKQRQPALPVNYRSAIKRRVSNEFNMQSPSSRLTEDNEEETPQNCSRASIESSPCLRQQGCISLDDVRRFSSLHITSRSSSRLERFSLRGGKIDRVARFAQLQKIWKKDSFVRGIDGEKRPQILHHLFTPTRAT